MYDTATGVVLDTQADTTVDTVVAGLPWQMHCQRQVSTVPCLTATEFWDLTGQVDWAE